jgi:AcrR family transcriptional regulator
MSARAPSPAVEGARREEILDIASSLVATSGLATSMKDIADACGILPGSLYHHFESKEAILIELVRRYQEDLERVAERALDAPVARDLAAVEERVVELGRSIASCAVRHRAALLVTLYEPPVGAGDELARLARRTPAAIHHAMVEILRRGRAAGSVRRDIDLGLFADRLCQSMLHHGVGDRTRSRQRPRPSVSHRARGLAVELGGDHPHAARRACVSEVIALL